MPTCSYMPMLAILSYWPSSVAVVAQLDRDLVLQAQAADLFLGEVELRLRQRHAVGLHAVVPGRVADQSAPAAADVEQPLAGRSRSLRQIISSLSCWACSSELLQSVK